MRLTRSRSSITPSDVTSSDTTTFAIYSFLLPRVCDYYWLARLNSSLTEC